MNAPQMLLGPRFLGVCPDLVVFFFAGAPNLDNIKSTWDNSAVRRSFSRAKCAWRLAVSLAENSIFVMNGKNKMKLGEGCKDLPLQGKGMVIHFSNTNNTILHGEGRRVSASPFKFGVSRILFPEELRH